MMKLRPESVPFTLRHIIPFAERFGFSGDTERHRAAELASAKELLDVSKALAGHHREIEDWLYSTPEADQFTPELVAFQSLVVFELEECGGPGLRGWLNYAISRFQDNPTHDNKLVLRRAYDYTLNAALNSGTTTLWARELRAAETILEKD